MRNVPAGVRRSPSLFEAPIAIPLPPTTTRIGLPTRCPSSKRSSVPLVGARSSTRTTIVFSAAIIVASSTSSTIHPSLDDRAPTGVRVRRQEHLLEREHAPIDFETSAEFRLYFRPQT